MKMAHNVNATSEWNAKSVSGKDCFNLVHYDFIWKSKLGG